MGPLGQSILPNRRRYRVSAFHTVIPHAYQGKNRLDAYHRHQLAWSVLKDPEKKDRDFVFYLSDKGSVLQFHFISPAPLIEGISREIPSPKTGDEIRWKILCNPVNKMGNKKIAIKDLSVAKEWLLKKLNIAIEIGTFNAEFLPIESSRKPGGTTIFIQQMLAEGTGEILNPEELLNLTLKGVGPSKAFGYGCFLWNVIRKSN